MSTTADSPAETKTFTLHCTWQSEHTIEVPVDFDEGEGDLTQFLDQVDSRNACLTDWGV